MSKTYGLNTGRKHVFAYTPYATFKDANGVKNARGEDFLTALKSLPIQYDFTKVRAKTDVVTVLDEIGYEAWGDYADSLKPWVDVKATGLELEEVSIEAIRAAFPKPEGMDNTAYEQMIAAKYKEANVKPDNLEPAPTPKKQESKGQAAKKDTKDDEFVDRPDSVDDNEAAHGYVATLYESRFAYFIAWMKVQFGQIKRYFGKNSLGKAVLLDKASLSAIHALNAREDEVIADDYKRSFALLDGETADAVTPLLTPVAYVVDGVTSLPAFIQSKIQGINAMLAKFPFKKEDAEYVKLMQANLEADDPAKAFDVAAIAAKLEKETDAKKKSNLKAVFDLLTTISVIGALGYGTFKLWPHLKGGLEKWNDALNGVLSKIGGFVDGIKTSLLSHKEKVSRDRRRKRELRLVDPQCYKGWKGTELQLEVEAEDIGLDVGDENRHNDQIKTAYMSELDFNKLLEEAPSEVQFVIQQVTAFASIVTFSVKDQIRGFASVDDGFATVSWYC